MRKNIGLSLLSSVLMLSACNVESPELIPCMCNPDADSTLGIFDCMCEPAKKKPVRKISYLQDTQKINYQSLIISDEQYNAYTLLHNSRDTYAPIKLENVDFRIKKNKKYDEYNTKLGDYRFRIFGCRRETKNAYLNQGRSMQKDMHFFDVFYETMNDYYPVVVEPSSVYYPDSDKIKQHEYVITAEITDYFMNICDEFDWQENKNKRLRNGTSEMTVVWRIMNLAKDEVYCKGTTTGYGQIIEGEPNGETLLVERAFEDALIKFPEISCVNQTLSQRLCAEDLEIQLAKLYISENCEDCFAAEYAEELKTIELLQECDEQHNITGKTVVQTTPVKCEGSSCTAIMSLTEGGTSGTSSALEESISEMVGGTKNTTITVADECQTAKITEECADYDTCNTILEPEENINLSDDVFVDIPLEIDTAEAVDVIEDGGTSASNNVVTPVPQTNVKIDVIGEDSYADVNNNFCIVNNPPFENLDPYNLYKLRSSIVSVENSKGKKGAGLLIAEDMILTSADLITKENNKYLLETLNGNKFNASAFRINPNKNIAVLLLEKPIAYQPLPMSLKLPEVNKDILLTLGMLNFDEKGENYIDNEGRVVGYRWTEDKGAEIIVDTFVQTATLGGALIDQKGNIIGISHKSKKDDTSPDLFIPIETALKSVGLDICGQKPLIGSKPKAVRIYTPIADAIDNSKKDKSPTPVTAKERK